ncbi:recombinase family protein [Actinomadura formosensis]|uniref:recombinase family protein n=1 Tax=Actinomadura formosensis TaxID=60706 RepID=UPI003D932CAD
MLSVVKQLRERGVRIVSLTENFDLETKEGRFMFAVLAAAADGALEASPPGPWGVSAVRGPDA